LQNQRASSWFRAAGIGKSRLAETLVERLAGEPHTRLRLFCSPQHQGSALDPTTTQLERATGFWREDTVEQRLDKLEVVLVIRRAPPMSRRRPNRRWL
jgi:predicted ATPase